MEKSITYPSPTAYAINDLVKGWRMRRLWLTLAWDDLRVRYKRSVLGPAWITLGTGFFIAVISFLWTDIMDRQGNVLVPWISIGLIHWLFISSVMTEGPSAFLRGAGIIQNISMPLSIHVYHIVMRHVFNYMHNFVIIAIVLILYPQPFSAAQLLFIPGILIILVTSVATSLFFGIIGARFRDFSHTVSMIMGPMFFLTPIVWMPDMLGGIRLTIANLNPFTHYLAIVRDPLLGRIPDPMHYVVTLGILLVMMLFALFLLSRYRVRIAYWL